MATRVLGPRQFVWAFKKNEFDHLDEMDRAVLRAAAVGMRVIRSVVPLFKGKLRRQTKLVVYGEHPLLCEIVEDTPYAAAQEAGTRPFTPPLRPLVEWAQSQLGADKKAAWAIAKAVQKTIATSGIKAKWHTRDAQPKLKAILFKFLKIAARKRNKQ